MPKKRSFAVFSIFCIISCSSTKLMPGYNRLDATNCSLGVVLIKETIEVMNPEDVAEWLGGVSPQQGFYDFFGQEFPAKVKKYSKFEHVVFARGADDRMDRGMSDARPDIVMSLPPGKRFFSDSLRYLLIVDLLGIHRIRRDGSQMVTEGTFVTGFRGGADDLVFSAMFTIWDNAVGTIAAYGKIRQTSIPFITMDRTIWMEMLERMAAQVTAGMPYRN